MISMAEQRSSATTNRSAGGRPRNGLAGRTIVQVLPALGRGGVERGAVEMAAAIIREGGHAVVVSNGGMMVSRLLQLGAEHVELPVHLKIPPAWPVVRWRFEREMARIEPDLVHVRSRAPAWIAIPAARRLGLPVVTTVHNRFVATHSTKRAYNGIMTRGDRVIAISDYIKSLVVAQFPEAEERISVIHRGVDLDVFRPESVSASRIVRMSSELNLTDDRPIVMLPARPSGWKGADLLIEAARLIRDMDFMMVLVGAADGGRGFQNRLISQIRNNGLDGRVKLCGGVDDMSAALMLADVVVMPSRSPEPFGRVAIEASAMGCPVVAFDHGGASESVRDGETGWLATPLDVGALASCLREALSLGAEERLELSENAREFVASKFSLTRMCDETIAVYKDLLGGRRAP